MFCRRAFPAGIGSKLDPVQLRSNPTTLAARGAGFALRLRAETTLSFCPCRMCLTRAVELRPVRIHQAEKSFNAILGSWLQPCARAGNACLRALMGGLEGHRSFDLPRRRLLVTGTTVISSTLFEWMDRLDRIGSDRMDCRIPGGQQREASCCTGCLPSAGSCTPECPPTCSRS